MRPEVPSEREVLGYFEQLSNWGRWGQDDELGTLNLITPATRLRALATVREGISVGCGRTITFEPFAADVRYPPQHFMIRSGDDPASAFASEFIGLVPHGFTISHVDALSHYFWDGQMYNGRPMSAVNSTHGATACSAETFANGMVTRGVLLDITRARDTAYLEGGEAIFVEDLEAAERLHRVRVTEGDALLLRTGWYRRRVELGPSPADRYQYRPGLHASTLPWLRERGVALVAADAPEDVFPSGYPALPSPVHAVGIVAMGLCLLDNCQFDALAVECERLGRWECLFIVAPLIVRNATSAPATPLAIL